MDYFSELLESYNKLKKRTFKLTYITEAEDEATAEDKATAVAKEGARQVYDPSKRDLKDQPYAFKSPAKSKSGGQGGGTPQGERVTLLLNTRFYELADSAGNPIEASRGWKVLVNFFKGDSTEGGGPEGEEAKKARHAKLRAEGKGAEIDAENAAAAADEAAKEQAELDEVERQKRMVTVGSLIKLDPERFGELSTDIIALENKNITELEKLCAIPGRLSQDICASPDNENAKLQAIGGSRDTSLESKLVNGVGAIVDDEGKLKSQNIGAAEIQAAFQTNLELLEEMDVSEPNCAYVKERLAKVGDNKIVLFTDSGPGGDRNQGIVLPIEALQESMLAHFKSKNCAIETYKDPNVTNMENNLKGRFNEGFMQLMTLILAKVRSEEYEGATKERQLEMLADLTNEFETGLEDIHGELRNYMMHSPMSEGAAISLEAHPAYMQIVEELDILSGANGGVKEFLKQYLRQMGRLVQDLNADDTIAGGEAQALGSKVDTFFLYKGLDGLERAEEGSSSLGLQPGDVVTVTPSKLYEDASDALRPKIEATLNRQGFTGRKTLPNPKYQPPKIPNPEYQPQKIDNPDGKGKIDNPEYEPKNIDNAEGKKVKNPKYKYKPKNIDNPKFVPEKIKNAEGKMIPNPKYQPENIDNPEYEKGLSNGEEQSIFLLSAGNKISKGGVIKFGELALGRAMVIAVGGVIIGRAKPADQDAWYLKLDDALGFTDAETGRGEDDAGSMEVYASGIKTTFDSIADLTTSNTYVGPDGYTTVIDPAEVIGLLGGEAKEKFDYSVRSSNFYNAITKMVRNRAYKKGSDEPKRIRVQRDPNSASTQAKAKEALQRDYLAYKFKQDYRGPRIIPNPEYQPQKIDNPDGKGKIDNPKYRKGSDEPKTIDNPEYKKLRNADQVIAQGATDCLCRMAGATIMEQSEMGQIVTMESAGEAPLVVNQNDILRGLGEARKNGSLRIEITGSSNRFIFNVKGLDGKTHEITYTTNMERTGGKNPTLAGKISKTEADKVGRKIEALKDTPEAENSSMLMQYLSGQMRLLETLISQSK